jgi:hypothetical protein
MQPTRARWPITMSQDGGRVGTTHSGAPIRYIRLEQHAGSSSLWFYNEDGDSFGTVEAKRASEGASSGRPIGGRAAQNLRRGGEEEDAGSIVRVIPTRVLPRLAFSLFLRRYSDRRALVATVRTHRPSQGGAEVKGRERAAPTRRPGFGSPRLNSARCLAKRPHHDHAGAGRGGASTRHRVADRRGPSAPPRCREPRRDRS